MFKKTLYSIALTLCITFGAHAQDPQFSQFFFSPMLLAPSFAGTTTGGRAALNYRMQWPTISKPFHTSAVGVDHAFTRFNSGTGLLMSSDLAGTSNLNRTKVSLLYSYNVTVTSKIFFRPGIEFSYNRVGVDYGNLIFGDQIYHSMDESNESDPVSSRYYFDAGASALVYSQKYWGGITMMHLMQPNESLTIEDAESKLPIKTSIYGGGKVELSGRIGRDDEESLFYGALYSAQGKYDQFDFGAYYYRLPFLVGAWYRGLPAIKKNPDNAINHDALILIMGYKVSEFVVAYSYDITVSRLFLNSGGAHEISLSYYFNQDYYKNRRKKKVNVPCPRF